MIDSRQAMETVVFLTQAQREAAVLKVAGLPLLRRTFRILKRSGICRVTLVTPVDDPRFVHWATESSIELIIRPCWQPCSSKALLLSADLALQHDYLRRFLTLCEKGEKDDPSRRAWVAAECGAAALMLVRHFSSETFTDLEGVHRRLAGSNEISVEAVTVDAVCRRISDRRSARRFHRQIEESMIKPTDGVFARWNRRISLPLSRLLVLTPITPNGVSYFTLIVALAAFYFLSRGEYLAMLLGGVLVQAASILDGNDGELARLKISDSDYGTWLDTICDYIAYFLIFGGVGLGLYRASTNSLYILMTALMFAGFALAMLLTSRMRARYTGEAGAGSLTSLVDHSLEKNRKESLFALISRRMRHFATRATFSYFVLLLAIVNGWQIIFWCALVGAQLFWMAVLYGERFVRPEKL